MKKTFKVETEGVLVVTTKKRLKSFYANKEFDYDYPEGLLPLINAGITLAFTTESAEEVQLTISDKGTNAIKILKNLGDFKLYLEAEDTLQILSHAEFTQICSGKKGDIDAFRFYIEESKIENGLEKGWYIVSAFLLLEEDEDYPINVLLQLNAVATEPSVIGVFDDVVSL